MLWQDGMPFDGLDPCLGIGRCRERSNLRQKGQGFEIFRREEDSVTAGGAAALDHRRERRRISCQQRIGDRVMRAAHSLRVVPEATSGEPVKVGCQQLLQEGGGGLVEAEMNDQSHSTRPLVLCLTRYYACLPLFLSRHR